MKVHTSFQRHEPDTIRGEAISVTQVFSSFDKREIDMLQNQLQEQIGAGVIGEVTLNKEGEETTINGSEKL